MSDVYSRNNTLNRPARTDDSLSRPLNSEDGTTSGSLMVIELDEISAENDALVRPVKVVLDIDYWNGAVFGGDPTLTIDASVLGTESDTVPEDSATQISVDTSSWLATSGNQPIRRRVSAAIEPLQYGQEVRITLGGDQWALRKARVYYEAQDDVR